MPKPVPSEATDPEIKTAKVDPASFEEAIGELEKLVADMEAGQLTLEQSLRAHKRGLELARFCQDTLARAEAQVRVLEGEMLRAWPSDSSSSGTATSSVRSADSAPSAPSTHSAHSAPFGPSADSDSSDD